MTSPSRELQEETKVATKPKAKIRKSKANAAGAQQAVVAVPGRQTFYHARAHMPMQDEEVKTLLADPWALPDSDDEEDLSEWKVGPAAITHPIWPTAPRPLGPPPPPVSVSFVVSSPRHQSWKVDQILVWLQERCRRKLRTQADLSNPEREFMFNWNMFLHQHPMHADLQVQLAPACCWFCLNTMVEKSC